MSKRKCNRCSRRLTDRWFKNQSKKTCIQCEFRWWQRILRHLAYRRKLSTYEKFASRVGYMGTGFLIAAQWTLEPMLYILGFCCIMIQTSSRKQWNLVALNINGLIAWIKHLMI